MTRINNTELVDRFEEFYRNNYRNEIGELAQQYPTEEKSLYVDWEDLYRFDPDLADDLRTKPGQLIEYAEEALRLYDLPADVSLGQAHVRVENLPEKTEIREIRADHRGSLIAVQGIVRKATESQPKIADAAFECQRCGTLTRIPQTDDDFQEPHECQGCERQGPFRINFGQSEFVDTQKIQLLDDPITLPDGTIPQKLSINFEDDLAGKVNAGERVEITGVIKMKQKEDGRSKLSKFDIYMDGMSINSLEHQFSQSNQGLGDLMPDLDTYADLAATAISTLPENVREEETKAKLITPLVDALGWNKFDSTEVRLEYTDSKTSLRPDYAFFGPNSDTPDMIIEAKQLGTILDEKEQQLYDYMRVFSAEWGVLTNGEEFRIYHHTENKYLPEKLAETSIRELIESDIVDSLRRSAFYESSS